jgi:hypothetical protein
MNISNKEETLRESVSKQDLPSSQSGEMPPLKTIPEGPTSIPEVVNRLEDLVRFALECEGKPLKDGVSFVDVFKQLEEVRTAIDLLNKDQQELLALFSSVSGGAVDVNTLPFSKEDRKMLDMLKHLQSVCEAAKERMYVSVKAQPESEAIVDEKIEEATATEKKKSVHRKGKFRPLGGKEGWMRT